MFPYLDAPALTPSNVLHCFRARTHLNLLPAIFIHREVPKSGEAQSVYNSNYF